MTVPLALTAAGICLLAGSWLIGSVVRDWVVDRAQARRAETAFADDVEEYLRDRV